MELNIQIAIDCRDPHAQADFWAAALGYSFDRDPDFIRQMIDQGRASDADTLVHDGILVWADGDAINPPHPGLPRIYLQRVPEGKVGKNRVHLDVHVGREQRDAQVERLVKLGATRLYDGQQGPHSWVTMADPEGNEFCVA